MYVCMYLFIYLDYVFIKEMFINDNQIWYEK